MNELLTPLLDLQRLSLGDETVRFGFERPMPAWAWAGVGGFALVAALWSYSRMTGPALVRVLLAGLRALLILTIVFLIAGPQLVRQEEQVERDWVMVLADRSASMTVADAPREGASGEREAREDQLRRAIADSMPMWRDLAKDRKVVWLGFDAGAYELRTDGFDAPSGYGSVDLGEPAGRRTSLATALDQTLRRAAARPLAGIVVLSDGRSMDEPSRAAIRRLQAERAPVFVVPLGSETPVGDLAVRRAEGPGAAFVDDVAPVSVDVEQLGGELARTGGIIRLKDAQTGEVLDEKTIDPAEARQTVTLTTRPRDPGVATWIVEAVPAGEDLIAGNNTAQVQVELVDRPLRVLYVDGHARWEQRFLRSLFLRETSITSSNLLLSPTRKSSQESDVDIDAMPESLDEWAQFDVVVLGDVAPDVFTRKQLEDLREHVATRGGGLLWIGGAAATPELWWGTPLADLLPFTREATRAGATGVASVLRPSPLADRFGVMRLGPTPEDPWPEELSLPRTGWSTLRWRQQIDSAALKPTAETLAYAVPNEYVGTGSAGEQGEPLVIAMRYGSGRVIYVATDEIWRWRYGRGEHLFERFYLQLVRFIVREGVSRAGRPAVLVAEPSDATLEQPVRVSVELLDQSLAELGLQSVVVTLTRRPSPGDLGPPPTVELTLRAESRAGRVFSATWLPPEAGEWTVSSSEPTLSGIDLRADVSVVQPDDELRRPEADHGALARLAEETGGRVLPPAELASLPGDLPNRQERIVTETTESLWDTPLALIVLIGLLTIEWVGRRLIRLV